MDIKEFYTKRTTKWNTELQKWELIVSSVRCSVNYIFKYLSVDGNTGIDWRGNAFSILIKFEDLEEDLVNIINGR